MKKPLLILTALFISVIGHSQTFTDANFIEYTIIPSTNTVQVTDYDYPNGGVSVNIPSTVDYNSATYNVTEIGDEAFLAYGATSTEKITSVVIPNSITFIGYRAFQGNLLATVIIPDSVTQLASLCFGENPLLETVVLSNNLTVIPNSSFVSCALINLTIPDNVTSLGYGVFSNNQLTSVTIPSNVTTIEARAFLNNPLTSVISEGITPATVVTPTGGNTSTDSFSSNRSTIDLFIPSGTLSAYASAQWTGFNSVTEVGGLAVGDTFIEDYITYEVTSVAPDTVKTIDYDMAGGTVVDIPAFVTYSITNYEVTEIGDNAFLSKGLTSVTIPDSVINIGVAAFISNALTSIIIPDSVLTIADAAFATNTNLVSVVIGNNVTNIGGAAFRYAIITNITIPESVTNIGQFAFYDTPLTDVTSLATTPPTIVTASNDSFSANRNTIALHIPPGTMGAYVTDGGALWTGFNPVTEDALNVSDYELANDVKVITTTDVIKIVSANSHRLENYIIYSITGAKVATGKESEIATSSFTSGIFILKLDFNKGTVIKKVAIN